jgi:hypothetical protein
MLDMLSESADKDGRSQRRACKVVATAGVAEREFFLFRVGRSAAASFVVEVNHRQVVVRAEGSPLARPEV